MDFNLLTRGVIVFIFIGEVHQFIDHCLIPVDPRLYLTLLSCKVNILLRCFSQISLATFTALNIYLSDHLPSTYYLSIIFYL